MPKKTASWNDYVINIDEKGKVFVFQAGALSSNTMASLRAIAEGVGFVLEDKWNTQQCGAKIVKFLDEMAPLADEKPSEVSKEADNESSSKLKKENKTIKRPVAQEKVSPTNNEIEPILVDKKATPKIKNKSNIGGNPIIETSSQVAPANSSTSSDLKTGVSKDLFFGRGEGLHNTAYPKEVLKLLTNSPFNLPSGIEELAKNIKAEQLEGVMTSYDTVFYHFKTTPKESAGLMYKANPQGANSYKSYRYHALDGLKIPVTDSLDSKKKVDSVDIILDGTIESLDCDKLQTCGSCNGKGKCANCSGKGEAICDTCNGTGKCEDCRGKGKVDCYSCNGSGRCSFCKGTGYRGKCRNCNGTGSVQVVVGKTADGKKKYKTVRCGECGGKGMVKCSFCDGSKKCSSCNGKGTEDCSTCYGSGRCKECNGSKKVTCKICKGQGSCVTCEGRGKVTCKRCNGSGSYQTYDVLSIKAIKKTGSFLSYEMEPEMKKISKEMVKPGKRELVLSWEHVNEDANESLEFCSGKLTAELIEALKQKGYYSAPKLSNMVSNELLGIEKEQWKQNGLYTRNMSVKTYGFPISKYEFDFESEHYKFYVVGANPKELMGDLPHEHFFERAQAKKGLFALKKSVSGLFKSGESKLFDRQVALVVLAVWLAKKTGNRNTQELLAAFNLDEVLHHDDKKVQKILDASNKEYSEKDLIKTISCLEESLSAVVWAYIFSGGNAIAKDIGSRIRKAESGYDFLDKQINAADWMKISPAKLLESFSTRYIPNNFQ